MRKIKKQKKIFIISFCILGLACIGLYFANEKARSKKIPPYNVFTYQTTDSSEIATVEEAQVSTGETPTEAASEIEPTTEETTETPSVGKEVVYLSDITYLKAEVGWGGSAFFDKNNDNTPLNLKINGTNTVIQKGIWAHATSTIDYDLTNYSNYTQFIAYCGISTKVANSGDGVKFYVYTSQDGENWDLRTDADPLPLKSADNARYLRIELNGAKYLRLYANQNRNNAQDHAVWGDAKLVTSTYQDKIMMTVEEFDAMLMPAYQRGPIQEDAVLPLLQREFIKNVGQYQLRCFVDEDPRHKETLEWFLQDEEALRLWTIGGTPNGTYLQALRVLDNLYHAHKEDLEAEGVTANGVPYKELYLKMMLSLSLSHSINVSLWTGSNPPSNAVTRYEIYKKMHKDGLLADNRMFETFSVEEMRIVMFTNIDDEEIVWLRDYSAKRYPDPTMRFYPGYYVRYTFDYGYRKPQYYSAENYDKWNQKYNLEQYNITYQYPIPKLWIVFEEGAVCGGISKTGANLHGVWGYPAKVCGQPAHAAYIHLENAGGGKKAWRLAYNVVSGAWANTGSGGRIPNGWGSRYATNSASIKPASYHFLAQEALNEYDKYEKAELILLQENIYKDDRVKLEQIYRDAIAEERINLDAWIGLVDLCITDSNATEEDALALAKEIAEVMKYHPLPMYDLTRRLGTKITTPENRSQLMMLQEQTWKEDTKATASQTLYAKEIKVIAEQLLGITNPNLATFSFDGANAGKIILSSQLQSAQVNWSYSIDGGTTWKDCVEHQVQLTPEEIANINVNQDIKIHISGLTMEPKNIYTIDITQRAFPGGVTANDEEDRLYGTTSEMEWTLDPSNGWNSFAGTNPIFEGEKVVYVRVVAKGTQLASNPVHYTFHKNNSDDTKWYIKPANLQIYEVNGTASGNWKTNILDGNVNTYWRSYYGTLPAYIKIKLDQPRYLSRLEFTPDKSALQFGGIPFGRARNVNVYVSMDGDTWDLAASGNNLGDNFNTKTIVLSEPKKAAYIKLECTAVYDGPNKTFTLSTLKLYENVIVNEKPRADVNYSITAQTNQNVTAELVNIIRPITVTNNNGALSHTFTENGEFTFEFEDADGNKGSATAVVDWIDKTAPKATVEFSTTDPTNDEVVATLTFDKPNVTTLSEGVNTNEETGARSITFDENTTYELRFSDALGNIGTETITVDWIDKDPPTAEVKYSTMHLTDQPVTVTLEPNEPVTVLSEGGLSHTFEENGSFTFLLRDQAGNQSSITTSVDWIAKVPEYTVTYSTKEWTTGNVTVTLELEDGYTLISNGGNNVYTFTQNGETNFEYRDSSGNIGAIPIRVDWIDREKPTAEIEFSTTAKTNQPVKATLKPNEPVTVLSEGGLSHTFEQNGTFTFELEDRAGNHSSIPVLVDWIDTVKPNATLFYDKTEKTDTDVTATITFDKPNVTVTNNNGATTYTFTKNGKFTFQFVDEAGNTNSITAEVTWIEKKEPEVIPPKDGEITSTKYEIKDYKIRKVPLDLSVSEFRKNIQARGEVILKDQNQKVLPENEKVGTGTKAYVGKNVYTFIVKADIDGNGRINLTDLAKVCLHYIEDELLEGEYYEAADLDDNQKITITDLAKIQLMLIESE